MCLKITFYILRASGVFALADLFSLLVICWWPSVFITHWQYSQISCHFWEGDKGESEAKGGGDTLWHMYEVWIGASEGGVTAGRIYYRLWKVRWLNPTPSHLVFSSFQSEQQTKTMANFLSFAVGSGTKTSWTSVFGFSPFMQMTFCLFQKCCPSKKAWLPAALCRMIIACLIWPSEYSVSCGKIKGQNYWAPIGWERAFFLNQGHFW